MKDSNTNYEALMTSVLELYELKHILSKTHAFFEEVKCNLGLVILVFIMYTVNAVALNLYSGILCFSCQFSARTSVTCFLEKADMFHCSIQGCTSASAESLRISQR